MAEIRLDGSNVSCLHPANLFDSSLDGDHNATNGYHHPANLFDSSLDGGIRDWVCACVAPHWLGLGSGLGLGLSLRGGWWNPSCQGCSAVRDSPIIQDWRVCHPIVESSQGIEVAALAQLQKHWIERIIPVEVRTSLHSDHASEAQGLGGHGPSNTQMRRGKAHKGVRGDCTGDL